MGWWCELKCSGKELVCFQSSVSSGLTFIWEGKYCHLVLIFGVLFCFLFLLYLIQFYGWSCQVLTWFHWDTWSGSLKTLPGHLGFSGECLGQLKWKPRWVHGSSLWVPEPSVLAGFDNNAQTTLSWAAIF